MYSEIYFIKNNIIIHIAFIKSLLKPCLITFLYLILSFVKTNVIFSILIISILYFTINNTNAQTAKYSNEFLSIGVGARSLGMGNSFISSVDDVTSGYWNPAGLTRLSSNIQVGAMHSEHFAGIAKYDYGALAAKIDSNSSLGVSFIRFGIDNIPNTIDLIDNNGNINYDRIKSFSAIDYAFLLSYARKLGIEGLSVGANAKIIRRTVGEFGSAWGFGIDAGVQYRYEKWMFATMARDVTSTFNAWSFTLSERVKEVFTLTGNEIPQNSLEITLPQWIIGVNRKEVLWEKFSVAGEVNFINTFDGMRNTLIKSDTWSMAPQAGIELGFKDFIYLRGGIGNFQKVKEARTLDKWVAQPNFGVGVRIKSFSIDYALTNITQSVGLYSNVFSLKLDINKRD